MRLDILQFAAIDWGALIMNAMGYWAVPATPRVKVFASFLVLFTACCSAGAATTTEMLAAGVYHDKYVLPDPNVVHLIRFDVSRPEYKLQLGFPQHRRNYTAKTGVSVISPLYDSATNHILAAINGSYFNVAASDPGITGMLVDASGYVQLAPYDTARARICFNDARKMSIEQNNSSSSPTVTFANGATASVTAYMTARTNNALACYMTTWGPATGTTNEGVEVIVSNVSYPLKPEKQVSGVVTAIRTGAASTNNTIPAGGLVLSGDGTAATNLSNNVAVGDRVYLQTGISTADFFWCNFALSGNGYLLSNGVPVQTGTTRDPQTVLAWNATNVFFMTVDGRQTSSIGMSWNGLATFLQGTVGATDALALDSGGSTTMWINGEGVVNSPSDGTERAVADAVMLVNAPSGSTFPLGDNFTSAGRALNWDDKFKYSAVSSFSPAAPGGDGYVLTVKNPAGGVDSARVGDLSDTNYTVQAAIYCEYRANVAANGYELCGLFARDNGNQAFTSVTYNGNCYALIYRTDNGQLLAAKVIGGAITDFLAARPLYLQTSGWHTFALRCYRSVITYLLDGSAICAASDTTFSRGYCGIGYQSHFSSTGNIHGTRADNFSAVVETVVPSPASLAIRLASGPSASLTMTGSIGATYRLDFSPTLPATHWTSLTNLFMSFSPVNYLDGPWSTNFAARFYRAVSVP
jgi:exopolysaccharide biosynthesis protein